MHLAQELVDYIIDFLHDDPTSLIQLSLVSRAWVSRARVHRWETMKIIGQELTFSNLSYLPPLCGYVKVLRFRWPTGSVQASTALDCFEQSTLHTLIIFSREFYLLDEQTIRRCFAKFPCGSITTLQLHDISPIHRNLIVLLSLFPNADNLSISVSRYWGTAPNPDRLGNHDKEIAQCTSPHRFRGSFKLSDPPCNVFGGCRRSKLLRTIAVFPLQFQTVSLDTAEYERGETSIFLKSCSKTARKLFVRLGPRNWIDWPSIDLPNLEELRVCISCGLDQAGSHPLLRSITSPCLQQVIIEIEDGASQSSYLPLDETLTNLVRRNNAHGDLRLQFSTRQLPERVRGLFPLVAQEGVLEVCHSVRPDYCA